jgi:hypothetical protein
MREEDWSVRIGIHLGDELPLPKRLWVLCTKRKPLHDNFSSVQQSFKPHERSLRGDGMIALSQAKI